MTVPLSQRSLYLLLDYTLHHIFPVLCVLAVIHHLSRQGQIAWASLGVAASRAATAQDLICYSNDALNPSKNNVTDLKSTFLSSSLSFEYQIKDVIWHVV